MALYRSLDIALRPSNYTFSFSTVQAPSPWLIYNGQNGLRGLSLPSSIRPSLPPLRTVIHAPHLAIQSIASQFHSVKSYLGLVFTLALAYLQLLLLAFWHHSLGHCSDPHHPITQQPFGQWCTQRCFPADFVHGVVVSLFAAVMTCPHEAVLECPTSEILSYVAMTFLRSHYQVAEGVQKVEAALTRNLDPDRIHTSTTVKGLHPTNARAKICLVLERGHEESGKVTQLMDGFDHVILATPAHLSASLVDSYMDALRARRRLVPTGDEEKEVLEQEETRLKTVLKKLQSIRVEESLVVNHTDKSLLPTNRSDWRDLNLASPAFSKQSSTSEKQALGLNEEVPPQKSIFSPTFSLEGNKGRIRKRLHQNGIEPEVIEMDSVERQETMATHVVCRLRQKGQMLLQTTNPLLAAMPRSEDILSTSRFQRAMTPSKLQLSGLFDWRRTGSLWGTFRRSKTSSWREQALSIAYAVMPASKWEMAAGDLQGGHEEMPGIWFCGSYSCGIPLLEGCVVGSDLVVERILNRGNL